MPTTEKVHQDFISNIRGLNDTCSHCQQVKGLELRSLDRFNDISCKFGLTDVFLNFPGLLRHNPVENQAFHAFREDKEPEFIETVFEEIFELHLPQLEDRWQRDDRICLSCWREILQLAGRDWWYAAKKTLPNYTQLQDCWYGHECRTQTHKRSHAERLNHLCDLIRRSAGPNNAAAPNLAQPDQD